MYPQKLNKIVYYIYVLGKYFHYIAQTVISQQLWKQLLEYFTLIMKVTTQKGTNDWFYMNQDKSLLKKTCIFVNFLIVSHTGCVVMWCYGNWDYG